MSDSLLISIAAATGTSVLAVLGIIGGMYKFFMLQANEKIEANNALIDTKLQTIKTLAEEAMAQGAEIEMNYLARFKETNQNITQTREDMNKGFGDLKVSLASLDGVEQMLKVVLQTLKYSQHSYGDK